MKELIADSLMGKVMGFLSVLGAMGKSDEDPEIEQSVEDQANDYICPEDPSEVVAGHPIVGAS